LEELRLVLRARRELLAALLVDLLEEVAVLGFLVVRVLDLGLPVELDQQLALADDRSGARQVDDDEIAVACSAQTRHRDGEAAHGLDRPVQADARLAVAGGDRDDGGAEGEREQRGFHAENIDALLGELDGYCEKKASTRDKS